MLRTESRRRKYPCPFPGCQKVFLTSYGLSKHRLSHEKNRELQKCSRCEKTFQTKEVEEEGRANG